MHYSKTSVIQTNAGGKGGVRKDDTQGVLGKLPSQEPSMKTFQLKNNIYIYMYNVILIVNKKREHIQQILSPELLPLKYIQPPSLHTFMEHTHTTLPLRIQN